MERGQVCWLAGVYVTTSSHSHYTHTPLPCPHILLVRDMSQVLPTLNRWTSHKGCEVGSWGHFPACLLPSLHCVIWGQESIHHHITKWQTAVEGHVRQGRHEDLSVEAVSGQRFEQMKKPVVWKQSGISRVWEYGKNICGKYARLWSKEYALKWTLALKWWPRHQNFSNLPVKLTAQSAVWETYLPGNGHQVANERERDHERKRQQLMPDGTSLSVMSQEQGREHVKDVRLDGVFRDTARARDHGRSWLWRKRFCSTCGGSEAEGWGSRLIDWTGGSDDC